MNNLYDTNIPICRHGYLFDISNTPSVTDGRDTLFDRSLIQLRDILWEIFLERAIRFVIRQRQELGLERLAHRIVVQREKIRHVGSQQCGRGIEVVVERRLGVIEGVLGEEPNTLGQCVDG